MKKLTCLPARFVSLASRRAESRRAGKILSIILLLTAVLFLSSKADAQTRQECEKTRDRASYNCLLEFGKCYSPCVAKTKDNMGCRDSCKQAENVCDKQVDADYQTCLSAIKKDSESPPETNASSEVQTNTDCHGAFTKESNACLKESSQCINSCVDKANEAMSLTVDGGKVMKECTKSVCDPASKACDDKTEVNFRACLDARDAKKESAPEVKKEAPKQTPPVFIGEWFSRFSKAIDSLIVLPGVFEAVLDNKFYIAPDVPDLSELTLEEMFQGHWYPDKDKEESYRAPNLTTEGEQRAWAFLPNYIPGEENITVVGGQGEMKTPTLNEFIPITPKGGDTLQVTYLDSTVRSTSDNTQLRYTWSADSGAVINVPKWSEIKFREPAEVGGLTSHTVELGQGEVEVKVRNSNPVENQFGVDAGWLGVTVSRTHFWISQSKDKKLAVIGVYEGEVEVKTKDGQIAKVKPEGDKPGVVVVAQKLSLVKLAITGSVFLGIIGMMVYMLKRKFSTKGPIKKRR